MAKNKDKSVYEKAMQIFSATVSRMSFMNRFGMTYNGLRDIYKALGWKQVLRYADFVNLMERNPVAFACIDRPVDGCWKDMPSIAENKGEPTPFTEAFEDLVDDLGLLDRCKRLDTMASLGHYAVALMGTDDVRKAADWSSPLAPGASVKLLYIKPVSEANITSIDLEDNTQNARYGLPKMYNIQLGATNNTSGVHTEEKQIPLRVHHSRLVHVAFDRLDSEYQGTPSLEAVYNVLSDLDKVVGGSPEMFWRGARPGYQAKIDPDFNLTETVQDSLKSTMDEVENDLRRIIMMQGVEMKALDQQISDPTFTFNVMMSTVSAKTGIPKRILLGSEVGELASTSDREAWLDYVSNRRKSLCDQALLRPIVNWCIGAGVLPAPEKKRWVFEWPDIYAPSDESKAKIGNQKTQSGYMYSNSPQMQRLIPPPVFLKHHLGYTDEMIEACRLHWGSEEDLQKELEELEATMNGGNSEKPIGDTGGNPEDSEGDNLA